MTDQRRLVICGAAGRDYHNFNRVYRDDPAVEVVAFTATQIPGIDDRTYPPDLAGPRYPNGIPIVAEQSLEQLIEERGVHEVAFAYSDVTHAQVMHLASRVLACGASFSILGPAETQVATEAPVIAISAVRTGCGKSQVARYLATELAGSNRRIAVIRHPMPYGMLNRQRVQRFASVADIDAADCTLEEREEYEPHVAAGNLIFAGVDYGEVARAADREADLIIWDGGNNDFPLLVPDYHIVVTDALRPDQLTTHHPGEAVLRMADLVIVNKADAAAPDQTRRLIAGVRRILPDVPILEAASPVTLDEALPAGSRVLVVEDGPTITHGGMAYGSGYQAIREAPVEIVDPRPFAVPEIRQVFDAYPHIGPVLPAMGYDADQREALRRTIEASGADRVVAGTPIDLARDLHLSIPVIRARYRYQDHPPAADGAAAGTRLLDRVNEFLARLG